MCSSVQDDGGDWCAKGDAGKLQFVVELDRIFQKACPQFKASRDLKIEQIPGKLLP